MRLKAGDDIKDFIVEDLMGKSIKLSDFRDKTVLLSFYRYASCPLCNLRIHQLINIYDELKEEGLTLLSFFESSKESMLDFFGKQQPPFSLIPDPERVIYKLYRVEHSIFKYVLGLLNGKLIKAIMTGFKIGKADNVKTMVPADFLIKDGKILIAYYGKDISDHLSIEIVKKTMQTLARK
jgi:peroxiredoxin